MKFRKIIISTILAYLFVWLKGDHIALPLFAIILGDLFKMDYSWLIINSLIYITTLLGLFIKPLIFRNYSSYCVNLILGVLNIIIHTTLVDSGQIVTI